MIEVCRLRVRSLDVDFHEVSWEVASTIEDVYDYTFEVLRSESAEGPFDLLTVPFQDRYSFVDNAIKTHHKWRQWYYKIRVTHIQSEEVAESDVAGMDPEPDLIAEEIRRHMQLLFEEFAGRKAWLLPVRTFGQRCACWDSVLRKSTRSGCPACYDTGFLRGYLHPIEIYIQIDPTPKADQPSHLGGTQQVNTTARMPYYPPLKPFDVVVEAENIRWRVVSVSGTEKGRAKVHQLPTLHEIPKNDIEYAVPLILDKPLKDISISPPRNYTNPQNLEGYEDEDVRSLDFFYSQWGTK